MVGLVVVVLFVLLAVLAPLGRALRSHRHELEPRCASRRPGRIGSAPTRSAATCSRRVIWGARASLCAGVVSVGIALGVGVPLGLLAGYAGGWIDAVLSRIVDAMLAIPFLILAIALGGLPRAPASATP